MATNSIFDQIFKNISNFGQGLVNNSSGPIVSPLPEKDTLDTPGKLNYVQQNERNMWAAHDYNQGIKNGTIPEPTPYPPFQYPDWMANAITPKAVDAIKLIRQANPNLKMSDADIAVYYNKYGDKLTQGLSFKPTTSVYASIQNNAPIQPIPNNNISNQLPTFKFQNEVNQVSKASGLTPNDFHLLRAGENKAENPLAINKNNDGTVDVGLYQINTNANNVDEIKRLQNPLYNTQKAADIWKSRMQILQDPVLAIGSYNLGAGGAVLNPQAALKRAQWVYYNAGVPMPQTAFTQDPTGYVNQRMDYYKQLGLFE